MKKKILIALLLVVVAAFAVGCTAYNSNLLTGGNFDYDTTDNLKQQWTVKVDDSSVSPVSSVDGRVKLVTDGVGWVALTQEVKLDSNSYYKLSYDYEITTMSVYTDSTDSSVSGNTGWDGLYFGFLEDESFNVGSAKTGLVTPVTHSAVTTSVASSSFYFKTNDISKGTLAINLGSKDAPVNAQAYVDNVVLEKVKKKDVAKAVNPETNKEELVCFNLQPDTYGTNLNTDKTLAYLILGGIATLIIGYAMYVLIQRAMAKGGSFKSKFLATLSENKFLALTMVLAIAFIVRLTISITVSALAGSAASSHLGFDVEASATQALFLGEFGPIHWKEDLSLFATLRSYSYASFTPTPVSLYLLALVGAICKGSANPMVAATFVIKLLGILADLGVAAIIYLIMEKRNGKLISALFALLYSVLPIVFSISASWGMMESIFVLLIVLSLYFMVINNYWAAVGTYFIAFCFSLNAIYLLPILIFYVINQVINKPKLRLWVPISIVLSLFVYYAITVPFNYVDIKGGSAFACVTDYWNAIIKNNNVYSMNAFNFQGLLGNNFAEVTTASTFITIIFDCFVIALVGVGYFKNKNRLDLTILGALLVVMLFSFTNRMTPVSMFVALALMLIYAGMTKDKRVYFCAIMYAALMFVNAGYIYMMTTYTTAGWAHLGYETAMMYVFGAFNLVLTLYFAYVCYDAVAARKIAKIKPMAVTYLVWVQTVGYRIKENFKRFKMAFKKQ